MNCSCGCKSGSMKEWNTECVEFRDLKPGDSAEIVGYREGGNINYKFKLLAMGLLRNRIIKVLHVSRNTDGKYFNEHRKLATAVTI